MKKSTVVAKCLVDLNVVTPMEEAEYRVHNIFLDNFPRQDFNEWDEDLPDNLAQDKIEQTIKDGKVNVRLLMQSLTEPQRPGMMR